MFSLFKIKVRSLSFGEGRGEAQYLNSVNCIKAMGLLKS